MTASEEIVAAAMDLAMHIDLAERRIAAMQEALESARPIVKHAAVDGSEEAERVLDMIEKAMQ